MHILEILLSTGAQRLDCMFHGGGAARFGGGRGGIPNMNSKTNDAQKWLFGGLNQGNNGPSWWEDGCM
jgi:hypothetical protein